MSRALFGTHAMPSSLRLADEVRRLRARIADLEVALAVAEAAASQRVNDGGGGDPATDAAQPQPATP